ncbi:MAG: GNAT family N-acetyltransferase [Deltaproteobacteria bacterium]|nr:GNAT family N-acetyltransferase [Deltaproteobacteria bacterium]
MCAKIPRYMRADNLRLRPLKIFDGPFIINGLRNEDVWRANGLSKPITFSWFSVWWYLKKTFDLSLCIEIDSRRAGFIGLYNLSLGKSAELSLLLFEKNIRQCGYGSRAFTLFAKNLKEHSVVKKIIIRVKIDNNAAISFYRALGFNKLSNLDRIKTMAIDLNGHPCRSRS